MFKDRKDAGQKLAVALSHYKNKHVLVLAIPKGGIEVGYEVAKYLNADLSLIIARKLPFPDNPEAGFGAVAEDGSSFIFKQSRHLLSNETVCYIIDSQKKEIIRRINVLREGRSLPRIQDRTVILIDDGIAMGSTMRASVKLCQKKKAKKIIVATPVSSREVTEEFNSLVDEVVILEKPLFFQAVAQAYRRWYDVTDAEAKEIWLKWKMECG